MKLSQELAAIDTDGSQYREVAPIVRSLPDNEVQQMIESACVPDMHYDDVFSALGKLVHKGINADDLKANSHFFQQYISPNSETFKRKTIEEVIDEHWKDYGHQCGTSAKKSLPADCFSNEVYNNLPEQLRKILLNISDARKRDVALMGMIGTGSAAAGRYRFFHGTNGDVKEYSPHLLQLIIGAAGSGKGGTRYGVELVDEISNRAVRMKKDAIQAYRIAKHEYDREMKKREKNSQPIDDLQEPNRAKKYAFFASASDTTQAALVEVLYENPIGVFAYDSELDTLVQGNQRKDFGGYSDIIRKVFHHEPLSRQRKTEGESYTVNQPRLAVILSGTHDQLKKLISSEYNGLFSRLWYYVIPPTFQEYIPAKVQADIIGDMCNSLKTEIADRADLWSGEIIHVTFSDEQEEELRIQLSDKKAIEERYGGDTGASWLRMALIVKRIAVTLSFFQGGVESMPLNCWKAAISLLPAIKTHNLAALDIVRQNQGKVSISKEEYDDRKKGGMSDEEIAKELGVDRKTIQRRKAQWDNGTK